MGIGWATSLLAFLALLMLPIPWVFFKYGEKIRSKSQYPKII
jgi:ABC-type transport system involved in cytochrome bd biosynthesis fused ATPase/permease subunit